MKTILTFDADKIGFHKELSPDPDIDARLTALGTLYPGSTSIVVDAQQFHAYQDIASVYLDDDGSTIKQRTKVTLSVDRLQFDSQPLITWMRLDDATGVTTSWTPRTIVNPGDKLLLAEGHAYMVVYGGITGDVSPINDLVSNVIYEPMASVVWQIVASETNPTGRYEALTMITVGDEIGFDDFQGFKAVVKESGIMRRLTPTFPQSETEFDDSDYVSVTPSIVDVPIQVSVGGALSTVTGGFLVHRAMPGMFSVIVRDKLYYSDPLSLTGATPKLNSEEIPSNATATQPPTA